MYKFATANKTISWVYGDEEIPLDLIYTCDNNEMINDKMTALVTAIGTLRTSVGIPATLNTDAEINILVGEPVTNLNSVPTMEITFTLEKLSDYYTSFMSINASRDDFYDYVNTYGLAEALERVFNIALDEYSTSDNLRNFVPTGIIINETNVDVTP